MPRVNACDEHNGDISRVAAIRTEQREVSLDTGSRCGKRSLRFGPGTIHVLAMEQYGRITEPKARLANNRPGTNQLQDPRHYRVGRVQARRHESQGLPSCGPG